MNMYNVRLLNFFFLKTFYFSGLFSDTDKLSSV